MFRNLWVTVLAYDDREKLLGMFSADFYIDADSVAQALNDVSMFNIVHLDSVVKVDMIVRKDAPYRQAEFERRRLIDLDDFSLWIVSKEDLILSKLVWAKPSRSELQLRDVRNLIASGADVEYLQQWAGTLSVQSQLEQCLEF